MNTIVMHGEAIRLDKRATVEITDAASVDIACTEGVLWITLDNDPRDIILTAGERFSTPEHRRALVHALQPAHFTVRRPAAPSWRSAPVWVERVVHAAQHAAARPRPA